MLILYWMNDGKLKYIDCLIVNAAIYGSAPHFANMIEILWAGLPPAANHNISAVYVIDADIYL